MLSMLAMVAHLHLPGLVAIAHVRPYGDGLALWVTTILI